MNQNPTEVITTKDGFLFKIRRSRLALGFSAHLCFDDKSEANEKNRDYRSGQGQPRLMSAHKKANTNEQ
ncbi:MAG: hypothetical protein JWM44_1705 [Bacilli bacterium]|nr:hypothetical protein [Bacilli bacterium]